MRLSVTTAGGRPGRRRQPAGEAALQGRERLVRALRPFPFAAHRLHRVGGEEGLQADGLECHPVLEHGAAEGHETVRRLRVHLLAQEVHEGVAAPADLVGLGGDRAQLALRPDLAEVDREGAQQLLGHEVDGTDVGVQEPRDVTLEEVRVGDVHAAQAQLDVERRRETLVQGGVGLDDVHPAADLGQMVGVDHRLPFICGATDLRILEAPEEDVFDDVIGGFDVARLADGHADGLVTLEAHQQELVVAIAEEGGEAADDRLGVHMAIGPHHLLDDAQEIDHRFLLPIAQGLVLQQEQADGEAILEILCLGTAGRSRG